MQACRKNQFPAERARRFAARYSQYDSSFFDVVASFAQTTKSSVHAAVTARSCPAVIVHLAFARTPGFKT